MRCDSCRTKHVAAEWPHTVGGFTMMLCLPCITARLGRDPRVTATVSPVPVRLRHEVAGEPGRALSRREVAIVLYAHHGDGDERDTPQTVAASSHRPFGDLPRGKNRRA